ncbi:MAG: carbon-nitrogen hydrolase family protein [Candidatus Micrarchaeaceae archaeon]
MSNQFNRRDFLKNSAAGASAVAVGASSAAASVSASRVQAGSGNTHSLSNRIGRPVRISSIAFRGHLSLDQIVDLVDQEGALGTDLISLPEVCRGQSENGSTEETLEGPTITAMARLARKHQSYIVCPIDRKQGNERFNSAVLLDRSGKVVCVYDKMYPVWWNECAKDHVIPGKEVKVHQADFGRVGLAICFDVNWTTLWKQLSNYRAELVIFPSAYSAGRSLQAPAISYNYYIVSCTGWPDCHVYDIDGAQLVHDERNRSHDLNVTRVTLDLDRCIFNVDLNTYPQDKRRKLLEECGDSVEEEKWDPLEGWFVLKAKRPGISCRDLARQYGLEELRHYINRAQCNIDKYRGWEFA